MSRLMEEGQLEKFHPHAVFKALEEWWTLEKKLAFLLALCFGFLHR